MEPNKNELSLLKKLSRVSNKEECSEAIRQFNEEELHKLIIETSLLYNITYEEAREKIRMEGKK